MSYPGGDGSRLGSSLSICGFVQLRWTDLGSLKLARPRPHRGAAWLRWAPRARLGSGRAWSASVGRPALAPR